MLFRLSKFFLYASAFTVVWVSTSTLFPFIVVKYAYFRGVVDLALIAFLAGLILSPEAGVYLKNLKDNFKSPLVLAVSLFTFIFMLAVFFGVRPSFSFWSNFERGEGGLQILHLYALFMLLISLFRSDADWRKLFLLSTGAGVLMIIYGVLAGSGSSLGIWGSLGPSFGDPNFRFEGSIGNSAYVIGYLIFSLFFAAYVFIQERLKIFSAKGVLLVLAMLVFLSFAILSGTRGGLFGLIAGVLAALVFAVYHRPSWRKWVLLAGLTLIIVLTTLFVFRHTDFVRSLPASRLFHFTLADRDVADRITMWGIAVESWQQRPLLGWGPENFLLAFDRNFDPAYFHPDSGFGAWFDRAHSVVFDYLATTGILGLLSYLSIFLCFGWMLIRSSSRRLAADPRHLVLQALLLLVVVAYLVQGLVLFDVLALYLPLFTFLAFCVYYFDSVSEPGKESNQIKKQ